MRIEERRRKLMDNPFKWGDYPPGVVTASGSGRDMTGTHTVFTCKDWSIDTLVAEGKNFEHLHRVSAESPDLASFISQHEQSGVPFIIQDCHRLPNWSPDLLSLERFAALTLIKQDTIAVRNCANGTDLTVPLNTFITKSKTIETTAVLGEAERLYGKDAPCPSEWCDWLTSSGVIPPSLLPDSPENLMLNTPKSERVETLMCYLGVGDTYTSMHKDLCASSGQNLMCYTENDGSSFWFMTESSKARCMSDYFHKFRKELDHETHVITLKQLAAAPCTVYIAQQKLGDLVFVPPRSCHQVVNSGGITIKTSWSRMTLQGLSIALYHELPIYRRVCRPEIYRVRSTIYHTLIHLTSKLKSVSNAADTHVSQQLRDTLELFDHILVEECSKDNEDMPCTVTSYSDGSNCPISCDFCGADIFQSFFECRTCSKISEPRVGDGYAICAGCYVEGRSCRCTLMEPIQYRRFGDLLNDRKAAVDALTGHFKASGTTVELKSEEELFRDNYTMIFTAGCILREKRLLVKRETRICNLSEPHDVPMDFLKNCKKCHNAACYKHSLNSRKIHSLEVLLASRRDKDDEVYHSTHRKTKVRYDQGKVKFRQTQEAGQRPDFLVQLVDLATSFKTCKPINSEFTKLGWYDESTQLTVTGVEKQAEAGPLNTSPSGLEPVASPEVLSESLPSFAALPEESAEEPIEVAPLGPATITESPSELEPAASPKALSESLPSFTVLPEVSIEPVEVAPLGVATINLQKRKRMLINYVDVPPLPAEYRSAIVKHHRTQAASMQTSSTLSTKKTKLLDYALMPPVPIAYRRFSLPQPKERKSRTQQSPKTKHVASTALPARPTQFNPKTRKVVVTAEKRLGSTLPKGDEREKKRQRLSHSQELSKTAEISFPQRIPMGLKFKKTPSTTDKGVVGIEAAYNTKVFTPTPSPPSPPAIVYIAPAISSMSVPHPLTTGITSFAESPSLPSIPYPHNPSTPSEYEAKIHHMSRQIEELTKELKEANNRQALHEKSKLPIPTEPRSHRQARNQTRQLHIHYHYHQDFHQARNMKSRNHKHKPNGRSTRRRPSPSSVRQSLVDRTATSASTTHRLNRQDTDVQASLSLADRIGDFVTGSPSDDEDNEPDGEKIMRDDGRTARSKQTNKPESSPKPVDQFVGDNNYNSNEYDERLGYPSEFQEPEEVRAASRGSSPVSMDSPMMMLADPEEG